MLKNLFIFCLLLAFTSCKINKLYERTTVDNQDFSTTIGFKRLSSGHIVIPVDINGEEYSFLVDTGTPNIVSKELAEKLQLEHIHHQKYIDSQDNKLMLSLSVIDEMTIGGIRFRDNATTIHNFEKSPPTIRCLEIAGVIGANLMKRAVWSFDFKRNEITISSTGKNTVDRNASVIDFTSSYSGTPKVEVDINGIRDGKGYVDFGAKGLYKSSKRTFKKLCSATHKHKCETTSGYGSIASGAFGYEKPDSSHVALVHSFSVGSEAPVTLKNQLITLSNHSDKLLGLDFFENFITTIDWFENKIYLSENGLNSGKNSYDSFGFRTIYQDEKLYAGFIYNNSPAKKAGLQLGDRIININEFDFTSSSEDTFCEFLKSNVLTTADRLQLKVRRGAKEIAINLQMENLFGPSARLQ
ncbi:MAG: aspartyl protease family protein [Cyclobacteriaceae bacterium]